MTPTRTSHALLALAALLLTGWGGGLAAQDPDSVAVPPPVATGAVSDTLEAERPDSVGVAVPVVDSLPEPHRLPELPGDARDVDDAARDVHVWNRADLDGRPHFTLLELLSEIPGTVPLRQGDFGAPEGIVLDGMAGSRVRVFFDGVEEIGLLGNAPDLSRIPLVGLERVVVRRGGGELRIELTPLQAEEARPLTLIEAGTGDQETNLFRGTFVSGNTLGGAVSVGIERIDTQGPGSAEPGSRQGVFLRYLRPILDDRLTVAAELRRGTSEQSIGVGPESMQRNATVVRARWQHSPDLVAETFWARNSVSETGDTISPVEARQTQFGARIGWETGPFWLRTEARSFSGDLPSLRVDVDGGVDLDGIGSARLRWGRDSFDGETASIRGAAFETASLFGFSVFGAVEQGERGWRGLVDTTAVLPPIDDGAAGDGGETPVEPYRIPRSIGTRDHTRIGVRFRGLGGDVSAARLTTESDSVRGFATFLDAGATPFATGRSEGWEVAGRWNLPFLRGLYLDGSLQRWDTPGVWRPEEIYRGGIAFRRTFYPTENFELWFGAIAQGRSEMQVPFIDTEAGLDDDPEALPAPATVPFSQSWNAWLQIRVVTVRIFVRWENLTIRQFNQDFPGRLLPPTRTMYGVRWALFN